jgi:hypothetical protein
MLSRIIGILINPLRFKLTVYRMIWTLSIVRTLNSWKTTFGKLDLFPPSGKERETHTLFGPLERANQSHFLRDSQSRCLPALT